MKTKLLSLAILLISFNLSYSQCPASGYTCIPDANFEMALVTLGYDSDGMVDGRVLTSDIENRSTLNIPFKNISSLSGIEDFVSLQTLYCQGNPLVSLDLSSNMSLNTLYCNNCQLTTLMLPNTTTLSTLYCFGNDLMGLDVTGNTNLFILDCNSNPNLGSLNLMNNTTLSQLDCSGTGLTSLDVTNSPNLGVLNCGNNSIASLDLSNNANLTQLYVQFNNPLTELDVSNNDMLQYLYCYLNPGLISLDVSNTTNLIYLYCYESGLQYLNVKNGHNDVLERMYAYTNSLTCIQVDDVAEAGMKPGWYKDDEAEYMLSCPSLGLEDSDLSNLMLYPNPTNSVINIDLRAESNYRLHDINGNVFLKGDFGYGYNILDTAALSSGVYFLHVETEGGKITKKIIKQ